MPGHVGTNIVANGLIARGLPAPEHLSDAQADQIFSPGVREALIRAGVLPEGATAEDLRQFLVRASADFRDKAPVSAAQAATIILDGVRMGTWRILIGEDAAMIDAAVRAKPESAYDYAELFAGLIPDGGDQAELSGRRGPASVRTTQSSGSPPRASGLSAAVEKA